MILTILFYAICLAVTFTAEEQDKIEEKGLDFWLN
jgi:preprotein translocase subunit SecG